MSSSACEVVSTTTGMLAQVRVVLDLREHLAAVAAGQVEVEQDQVGPRRVGVLALAAQEGQRLARRR